MDPTDLILLREEQAAHLLRQLQEHVRAAARVSLVERLVHAASIPLSLAAGATMNRPVLGALCAGGLLLLQLGLLVVDVDARARRHQREALRLELELRHLAGLEG